MSTPTGRARTGKPDTTPDSHDFPTRPYDLVKEFVIALTGIAVLTVLLAAVFSSPDDKAITLQDWAKAAPNEVVIGVVHAIHSSSAASITQVHQRSSLLDHRPSTPHPTGYETELTAAQTALTRKLELLAVGLL